MKIEGNVFNDIQESQDCKEIYLKKNLDHCHSSPKNYKQKLKDKQGKENLKLIEKTIRNI